VNRVSRLALGTVQFGLSYGISNKVGQISPLEAKEMLQLASSNSINILDTAIDYGNSEITLGNLNTKTFGLITKLPTVPSDCENVFGWVLQQVVESLKRLNVNSIYGLLLHRPEQLFGSKGNELYQALQKLKDTGKVQKIGISANLYDELERLISKYQFDLVQAPLNLVDRRLYNTGLLHRLKEKGVEVHTRSVFLQGLLLMPRAEINTQFSKWNHLWNSWHQWLEVHDVSAVQACLAYPLSFPEIDRVVVGAESTSQLREIIDAVNKLPKADLPDLQCVEENLINPANWEKL